MHSVYCCHHVKKRTNLELVKIWLFSWVSTNKFCWKLIFDAKTTASLPFEVPFLVVASTKITSKIVFAFDIISFKSTQTVKNNQLFFFSVLVSSSWLFLQKIKSHIIEASEQKDTQERSQKIMVKTPGQKEVAWALLKWKRNDAAWLNPALQKQLQKLWCYSYNDSMFFMNDPFSDFRSKIVFCQIPIPIPTASNWPQQ